MKLALRFILLALVLLTGTAISQAPPATAVIVTKTWTGLGADDKWNTGQNWDGGVAPTGVGGEDLVFPGSASQKMNTNDLPATASFNSISFTGPAAGYNISGTGFTLANGISADNSGANFFYPAISLLSSQTFTITGDRLAFYGPIDLGSHTLTVQGSESGVAELRGGISGTGGITSAVGYLYVSDVDPTYTGPTNVTDGWLGITLTDLDPASMVTVGSGGTLLIVNGSSAGAVDVQSGGALMLDLGGISQIGHIVDLTLHSGSGVQLGMNSVADYGQMIVSGGVSLGGANLYVVWKFPSSTGNAFTIIDKTSSGPMTGTFNGLAEGATFSDSGRIYQITYHGGTGNDVVLTDIGMVTATPTPTPTPTPTITPTATPTHTPTPTPTATAGPQHKQGDLNCDGKIDSLDALIAMLGQFGLTLPAGNDCPPIGQGSPKFGDVNCSGAVDEQDALAILAFVAEVSLLPQQPPCTPIGQVLA